MLVILGLLLGSMGAAQATTFPLQYDSIVPITTRIQLESDLSHFFAMQGANATPLYRKVFGPFTGKSSAKWFFERVGAVGQNLCTTDSAVACVLSAWDGWIFLSPNYTKFQHPTIARLMVLFHEARHNERENQNWPHAKCPKNYVDENGQPIRSIWTGELLAGELACDLDIGGSYSIATILLLNIAYHCDNCSAEDRHDAELYGLDQLRRIIWKPAQDAIIKDAGLPKNFLSR